MAQMERDLDTQARLGRGRSPQHRPSAQPISCVRGVTDDGKILNIAGDYIAHGIRHRASEIVTLELGPQTE